MSGDAEGEYFDPFEDGPYDGGYGDDGDDGAVSITPEVMFDYGAGLQFAKTAIALGQAFGVTRGLCYPPTTAAMVIVDLLDEIERIRNPRRLPFGDIQRHLYNIQGTVTQLAIDTIYTAHDAALQHYGWESICETPVSEEGTAFDSEGLEQGSPYAAEFQDHPLVDPLMPETFIRAGEMLREALTGGDGTLLASKEQPGPLLPAPFYRGLIATLEKQLAGLTGQEIRTHLHGDDQWHAPVITAIRVTACGSRNTCDGHVWEAVLGISTKRPEQQDE